MSRKPESIAPEEDLTPTAGPGYLNRNTIGLVLGPLLAVAVFYLMPDVLPESLLAAAPEGTEFTPFGLKITAATATLMATWWVTEAIPLPATALLPLVIFPVSGITTFGKAAAPYANGTIFLFMGGFFLALSIQRWNLHRRIALAIVLAVGTRPKQLVLGLMIATGFMTMWVSNTATAVMMLPIALSVLSLVYEGAGTKEMLASNFGKSMVLGVAYAASITSVSTLIGTSPNALLRAYVSANLDTNLSFGKWMLFATPMAWIFLFVGWWLITSVIFKPEITEIPGGRPLHCSSFPWICVRASSCWTGRLLRTFRGTSCCCSVAASRSLPSSRPQGSPTGSASRPRAWGPSTPC